ncbi:MAG: hypothetical protein LBH71_02885 [Oscillospiraceae bacterium]|jgi:sporulation integral membrane protein YlbJ|nr:hypothetical protein [Oscillospiraceae bacterium]
MLKSGLKNIHIMVIVILLSYALLSYPGTVTNGVTRGLTLCAAVVIPSLFPFMVLSSFIVKSGLCSKFGFLFDPVTRTLFKLPGNAAGVVFMSLIGGFPVGPKMTYELYENGEISKSQARMMMFFCMNAGPAFVLSAVGYSMYNSSKVGLILFASICASSIIVGVVTSIFDNDKEKEFLSHSREKKAQPDNLTAFTYSVSDGANSILSVCIWVVIFSCIGSLLELLPIEPKVLIALKSILEVTSGVNSAAHHFSIPSIAFILGWSGLCVHCQVMQYIQKVGAPLFKFWLSRLANATIASVICSALLDLYPVDIPTMASPDRLFDASLSVSAPGAAVLLSMCALLILDLDTKRKV